MYNILEEVHVLTEDVDDDVVFDFIIDKMSKKSKVVVVMVEMVNSVGIIEEEVELNQLSLWDIEEVDFFEKVEENFGSENVILEKDDIDVVCN